VDSQYLPKTYTVPFGSVAALKDRSAWVTTVSPKFAVNFVPLLGQQEMFKTLSLAYVPEFAVYRNLPTEDYDAQRLVSSIKGKEGSFSFGADNTFSYVDGSRMGPTYPSNYVTAYNVVAPRERRKQIQDKAGVFAQYDVGDFFIRPTASLIYYDMMTELMSKPTGYLNYEDRNDVNGGADAGYKFLPGVAATVGYRYGHQYQQQYNWSTNSSSSDYQRVLIGLEGKPWKWLEIRAQGGPDFRSYDPDSGAHVTPVGNKHMITYYGEASVTATITTNDSVAFKYKQWQWESSISMVPYFDSTYDLSYHRKITQKLGADLGAKLLTADYTTGDLAACRRDDWQYTFSAGLGYALSSHASVNLTYALDLGRNDEDNVENPSTRNYERQVVSLGATVKF
jgi:opacity protein-like surface antigen